MYRLIAEYKGIEYYSNNDNQGLFYYDDGLYKQILGTCQVSFDVKDKKAKLVRILK